MRATYFKDVELACKCGCGYMPQAELVAKLDSLRLLVGEPIVVTSVARCEKHNRAIGGSPKSAHVRGLAADIRCVDSFKRYKLVELFFTVGFRRMEWGTPTWLHFDLVDDPKIFLP